MSPLIMKHDALRTAALLHLFLLIYVSVVGQRTVQSSPPPKESTMEEKNRLGSTPPSCHNRCNNCYPCTAVQVPTMPGPTGRLSPITPADHPANGQYNSNYKPLGWMCCCGGRVYNP